MDVASLTVANGVGALGAFFAILTVVYGLFFYRLPVAGSAAVWNVPALLGPLALAMALLSASLALGAAALGGWQAMAWWVLALLFLALMLAMVAAGMGRGWDAPLAGRSQPSARGPQQATSPGVALQGGLVLTLVTVNLAMVLAWGAAQLTRGAGGPVAPPAAQPAPVANVTPTSVPAERAATAVAATPAPVPTAAASATPAPALVSLPTATPAAPAAPTPGLVVRSPQGVNARQAPGVAAAIVRILADGEALPVRGISADGQWVQAALDDGALVWVARTLVELTAPAESLPVVPSAP